MDAELRRAVQQLVDDLAVGRYRELERGGRSGRLTAEDLRGVIEEYGRTLLPLPEEAWALVDVLERTDVPNAFAVDVPLWTAEEGRSDLTLSLTAVRTEVGLRLEIDDLRVL